MRALALLTGALLLLPGSLVVAASICEPDQCCCPAPEATGGPALDGGCCCEVDRPSDRGPVPPPVRWSPPTGDWELPGPEAVDAATALPQPVLRWQGAHRPTARAGTVPLAVLYCVFLC